MSTDVEVLPGSPADSPRPQPAREPSIAVIGDALECLTALRSAPGAQSLDPGHAAWGGSRAVIIGVDIRGLRTSRQVRAALRTTEDECTSLCGRLRRLKHIILVLNGSLVSEDTVLRISDGTVRRIHTRLEQAYARSVVITAVLAEHCDDRELLTTRLIARVRERESLDAGIALLWKEIAHTSISVASMNDYL
ncbi:hypothetical protein V6S02_01210 [Microbacterium sp. CCNWLW134]|uniref:hypothetical protein n=1 Tax=Microbacterium sp. CCNWLW134 TaxID=3122064 RepID=UPI00300F884B